MSGGDEARVKILHLAAEVAETEDSNVPIRLKQLQSIALTVFHTDRCLVP